MTPDTEDVRINRRYSKHFNLSGFPVVFNFPGAQAAINSISDLCGVNLPGRSENRNASNLSLKQHFPKPFPKKFRNFICAEDCLTLPTAQTRNWLRYRTTQLRKIRPVKYDIFDHPQFVSSIKMHLLRQFLGDSDVN